MGRKILGLFLFVGFALQAQNPYPESTAKKQYEMGVYDLALGTYMAAEKAKGLTGEELFLVADILQKTGDYQKSKAYYDKASSKLADASTVHIAKSRLLLKMGAYEEAAQLLSKVSEVAAKQSSLANIEYAAAAAGAPKTFKVEEFIASERPDFGLTMVDGAPVFNTYGPLTMSARSAEAVRSQIGFSLATKEGANMVPYFEGLSNRLNIGTASFSKNGKVVFTRTIPLCEYAACRNQNASIYIADLTNGVIANEKSLDINKVGLSNFDPHITADGKTLYFVSNGAGGFGGTDLYKMTFNEGKWSAPVNLGPEINTAGDEMSPMVSGDILYFASNGHVGLGGYDLFSMSLKGNGKVNNLSDINSSFDDTYPYVVSEKEIYFTSNRNPKAQENIFVAKKSMKDMVVAQTAPEAVELETGSAVGNPSLGKMEGARRVSIGTTITKSNAVVYYIQLAAFNKNNMKDFNQFRDVVKFGNIYKFEVGPAVKVRLGYFLTEQETRNILMKIKKSGYPDAFVVSNALNTSEMELVLSSFDGNTPSPSGAGSSTSSQIAAGSFDSGSVVSYKVRLASYEDPIWFDLKKVNDLGHIEQWSKGTWTIFVLSGFRNFQDAESARVKAVNRGFPGAEVVIDNGGVIETIKKN